MTATVAASTAILKALYKPGSISDYWELSCFITAACAMQAKGLLTYERMCTFVSLARYYHNKGVVLKPLVDRFGIDYNPNVLEFFIYRKRA